MAGPANPGHHKAHSGFTECACYVALQNRLNFLIIHTPVPGGIFLIFSDLCFISLLIAVLHCRATAA